MSDFFVLLILTVLLVSGCRVKENADMVLWNARVITMDDRKPAAHAVAIRDGLIVGVGLNDDILDRFATTRREDLQGATVLPGFTDAHLHLLEIARSLRQLDLQGTTSYEDVLTRTKTRITETPAGRWVRGRGWDQNDWTDKDFPTHDRLTALSPNHFVYLTRVDGHAVLVNRKVMELCGISRLSKDPSGGRIVRDERGEPTGVLIDNAINLVTSFIPLPTRDEDSTALKLALESCAEAGLTSVHDAGVDQSMLALYEDFGRRQKLTVRIYAMLEGSIPGLLEPYLQRGPQRDLYGGFLSVSSIKLYADGALGSRGAALLEPYSDQPDHNGLLLTSPNAIQGVATKALRHGFQLAVHAIGDRGNRLTLDTFEKAFADQHVTGASVRFRIEHAQVLSESDISRLASLGVVASMQPTHCTSDMYWAEDRLGKERIKGAYAWRNLIDHGTTIACGSDAPIESHRPLWGIYAAVTRQDHRAWPDSGWYSDQRMTILEAIRGFTINAAYAAFEENRRGTIETGKQADLVVLSRDITAIPPSEILKTDVLMTLVDGHVVYRR